MEEFVLVLGKLDEEINEITIKLQEFEEFVFLKEKEVVMVRFQRLRFVFVVVLSERLVVLELGDFEEVNIFYVEVEVVDFEVK